VYRIFNGKAVRKKPLIRLKWRWEMSIKIMNVKRKGNRIEIKCSYGFCVGDVQLSG
jgi:hypothetical protein